jgi:hypothetical protein
MILSLCCIFTSLSASIATAETDHRGWQLDRIHAPTGQQLVREQAGRVSIFDGLRDSDVELAMDIQFDRVASMMFVRTVVTDDTGTPRRDQHNGGYILEDDDCD